MNNWVLVNKSTKCNKIRKQKAARRDVSNDIQNDSLEFLQSYYLATNKIGDSQVSNSIAVDFR